MTAGTLGQFVLFAVFAAPASPAERGVGRDLAGRRLGRAADELLAIEPSIKAPAAPAGLMTTEFEHGTRFLESQKS